MSFSNSIIGSMFGKTIQLFPNGTYTVLSENSSDPGYGYQDVHWNGLFNEPLAYIQNLKDRTPLTEEYLPLKKINSSDCIPNEPIPEGFLKLDIPNQVLLPTTLLLSYYEFEYDFSKPYFLLMNFKADLEERVVPNRFSSKLIRYFFNEDLTYRIFISSRRPKNNLSDFMECMKIYLKGEETCIEDQSKSTIELFDMYRGDMQRETCEMIDITKPFWMLGEVKTANDPNPSPTETPRLHDVSYTVGILITGLNIESEIKRSVGVLITELNLESELNRKPELKRIRRILARFYTIIGFYLYDHDFANKVKSPFGFDEIGNVLDYIRKLIQSTFNDDCDIRKTQFYSALTMELFRCRSEYTSKQGPFYNREEYTSALVRISSPLYES